MGAYLLAAYGVAMAATGMLSFVVTTVSVDVRPDRRQRGWYSRDELPDEEVRQITDTLDAVGNTTAAIGKVCYRFSGFGTFHDDVHLYSSHHGRTF